MKGAAAARRGTKGLVRKAVRRRWCLVAMLLPLGGCVSVGSATLSRDQIDYASTLAEAGKQQILLNIVRLRFGDSPAFVGVTQIIAGYTAQGTVQAGLNAYPNAVAGNYATALGTLQYTDHPTFTFAPINGEKFSHAYLRPLTPVEILPLAQSGIPIDILLRVAVQSLNGLQSSSGLQQSASASAASFYSVIQNLRLLQETGGLSIVVRHEKVGEQVALSFSRGPTHEAIVARVQELLHLDPKLHAYDVIYAAPSDRRDVISVVTRPMLGIFAQIGAQATVPAEEIAHERTRATMIDFPAATRSAILVQNGDTPPNSSYAQIRYGKHWYWVADDDYDSKVAFTIVQILEVLAQSTTSLQTPIITIPTN